MKENKIKNPDSKVNFDELNEITVFEQFAKGSKKKDGTGNTCVIYTRVSGKEQEEGYSLDTQKRECEEFASKNEYEILGSFGGTYESAKNDERKEFNRMLQYIKRSKVKVSYIIVYMLDRFSRSGANAIYIKEQLKSQGIYIQSVKQPIDGSTSSGDFQQNIHMIFSHYDNQLRKERCMAGTREALMRGVWCAHKPIGYDKIVINGETKLVVNNEGKLLRKAFYWKVNENLNSEQCVARLENLGLKVSHQKMSTIFRNPFYCGMISHNLLEGKMVNGKHEKLISKEIFLKVNEIQNKNSFGYKQTPEQINIPLKVFVKCDKCGTGLTGYVVKRKNLWYYKCRSKGCCVNKSSEALNVLFENVLTDFILNSENLDLMQELLITEFDERSREGAETVRLLKEQYQGINGKLERLEERFMSEEITKELYLKYVEKHKEEQVKIQRELQQFELSNSNPEDCARLIVGYAQDLRKMWLSSDYVNRQKLQNYLFPKGIRYCKNTGLVRTEDFNSVFLWIALKQGDLGQKKCGIPSLNLDYAALVAGTGLEPMTFGL
jgi:site-specific DNA recombinase